MVTFLLRKIFRGNLNEQILAEIVVTLKVFYNLRQHQKTKLQDFLMFSGGIEILY